MTDEHKPDEQHTSSEAASDTAAPVDPWAVAFASLEEPAPPADDSPEAGSADGAEGAEAGQEGAEGDATSGTAETPGADAELGAGDAGGSLSAADEAGVSDDDEPIGDVEEVVAQYAERAESQAIEETARLFLERTNEAGERIIRQTDGRLGATINDPDIYRVVDGVPQFFNPDTGRAFTGDNPRAQAQAWVEAYNKELRATFNRFAEQRQAQIEEELAPVVELLKFTPTYEKLNPVRRQMLDALLEDYEVYDGDDNHIGYSVDLNQALAQVDRQIAAIQAANPGLGAEQPKPPTGPALDMPTSGSGNAGGGKEIKSIEDAMEAMQDEQLAKLNKK